MKPKTIRNHCMEPSITPIELADCLGGITVQGVYKALKSHDIKTESPPIAILKAGRDRGRVPFWPAR